MKHNYTWATFYGGVPNKEFNQIHKISLNECRFVPDWDEQGPAFLYFWGWPGPDCAIYLYRDFGKTWAYELEQFSISNVKEYIYEKI